MSVPVPGEPSEQAFSRDTYVIADTNAAGARDPFMLTSQVKFMREGFEKAGHGRPALILLVVKDGEEHAAVDLIRGVLDSPTGGRRMTDPSEALPFSEAAREAAALRALARGFDYEYLFDDDGENPDEPYTADYWCHGARQILAAAVNADPRLKAFLRLAALSDEELVERVLSDLSEWRGAEDYRREVIRAVLAALGLPVAERDAPCRACGGRGWHTAGGNDPAACNCPAGEAWAEQEPTGGER